MRAKKSCFVFKSGILYIDTARLPVFCDKKSCIRKGRKNRKGRSLNRKSIYVGFVQLGAYLTLLRRIRLHS